MCFTCVFIWLLVFCHRLIFYEISDGICGPQSGFYDNFDNYIEVVFKGLCPPTVMVILAYLLIRSVQRIIQNKVDSSIHAGPIVVARRLAVQQADSRLTFMLMLQSIIATATFLPLAVELMYEHVTGGLSKSSLRSALDKVFAAITHLLSYTFFASSFYVSIATNAGFRRQIRHIFEKSLRQDHRIGPAIIRRTNLTVELQPK